MKTITSGPNCILSGILSIMDRRSFLTTASFVICGAFMSLPLLKASSKTTRPIHYTAAPNTWYGTFGSRDPIVGYASPRTSVYRAFLQLQTNCRSLNKKQPVSLPLSALSSETLRYVTLSHEFRDEIHYSQHEPFRFLYGCRIEIDNEMQVNHFSLTVSQ